MIPIWFIFYSFLLLLLVKPYLCLHGLVLLVIRTQIQGTVFIPVKIYFV